MSWAMAWSVLDLSLPSLRSRSRLRSQFGFLGCQIGSLVSTE